MNGYNLLEKLVAAFGAAPRPATLLDMSDQNRKFYAVEVAALEAMDWDNGTAEDLSAFYEPNTFLSVAGYRYLIPKVFAFCQKWPEANADIISIMKQLPFIRDGDQFLQSFVGEERRLLWQFLEEMYKLAGDDIFEDLEEEAMLLHAKLTQGETL